MPPIFISNGHLGRFWRLCAAVSGHIGYRGVIIGLMPLLTTTMAAADDGQNDHNRMDLLDDRRTFEIGDRLAYQVLEEREPAVVLFVNDRGEVEVPLAGPVAAHGLTARRLAYRIKDLLEQTYFHRATVLVQHSHADNTRGRINLVGRVQRPGPQQIPADEVLTVSSAILRAGGFAPGADRAGVTIVRAADGEGGEERITVDLVDVLENGNLAADRVVRPEDVIVVPERADASGTYYVTGEVGSPGVFNIPPTGGMQLSEAILRAGGFAKFADRRRVQLIRGDTSLPEDERRLTVNVQAILEDGQRDLDVPVYANDIIRVRDRPFVW